MTEEWNAYQAALDYIYSFVDYSLTRNFRNAPEVFDLGRMRAFLRLLGDPQRAYPVIHVAGTKGKGSTAAMVASALTAAGYTTGLYTSPHLQEFTERIQVNGQQIGFGALAALVEAVKPVVAQVERLTTFEITTALAFLYFARAGATAAVIEVGLGGRLDATNVVDPLVSVITALSMDHTAILGDTIEKIAFEKAGIIKPGRPVVLAAQQRQEARATVAAIAAERGSRLIDVASEYRWTPLEHSLDGQKFRLERAAGGSAEFWIPLLGQHQVGNAATACAALETAREEGLEIPAQAIVEGFARVSWPGRFELLRREPPVIADSAHNRESALRLRQALDEYFPGRPVVLLFGASEDKDIDGMFDELLPRVERLVATQSVHPRAASAAALAEKAQARGVAAQAVEPVEAALHAALAHAGERAVVVAAGSLFLAAAVRACWQKLVQNV